MEKSSKKLRCINIDWLELYVLESMRNYPMNADFFRAKGWFVKERDYGTRVYREMFTLFDVHDEPYIEVRRAPSQTEDSKKFFEPYSCHLRLHNRACYDSECVRHLQAFVVKYGYTFKKIYRIDICCDFVKFDNGDDPQKFLRRYMQGRYSKINQTNVSAHGVDLWDGRYWNSLSWGQPKSMVSTKFYNKTMELRQVKDKPYIRFAWFLAGLVDDPHTLEAYKADGTKFTPDIWRVEFSIRASAAKWYVMQSHSRKKPEIVMPNTLDVYSTRENLIVVFESLASHYFHFKKFKSGQRKDRCEDKVLFKFTSDDTIVKVDRNATHRPKEHSLEMLLKRLQLFRASHQSSDITTACDQLISYINELRNRNMSPDPYDRVFIQLLREAIAYRVKHPESDPISVEELRYKAETLPPMF